MEFEHVANWNSWWRSKEVPTILKGTPRPMNPLITQSLKEREIIVLTGIRRCGKTTMMYQMIDSLLQEHKPSQILYLNLDDELLQKETLESLYLSYREHKNPNEEAFVFLDEIQNKEGFEKFLKKYYDLRERVKFVISGSCANLLKGEFSTLLTGRNLTFSIFPLSFPEFLGFCKVEIKEITTMKKTRILHELQHYFEYGGFPEVYFKEEEIKKLLLKQYFEDIIYKDVVKRHNINATKVTDLALYLLTNLANPFTIRKIRNFTGLSIDSIKDYISYLQDAYLVIIVHHFSYSLKEASQLPKKSYAIDCGLRNIAGFRFSKDIGRLAENCICVELKRREKEFYYWKGRGEVDFVIKHKDHSLTAINVSYTDTLNERELKSLHEFKKKFKKCKELIMITKNVEEIQDGVKYIPLWKWLVQNQS